MARLDQKKKSAQKQSYWRITLKILWRSPLSLEDLRTLGKTLIRGLAITLQMESNVHGKQSYATECKSLICDTMKTLTIFLQNAVYVFYGNSMQTRVWLRAKTSLI